MCEQRRRQGQAKAEDREGEGTAEAGGGCQDVGKLAGVDWSS